MSSRGGGLWTDFARRWSLLGPPLRPAPSDVELARAAIRDWRRSSDRSSPTVLVLGVTAELCAMAASEGCRVLAVDRSIAMIRALWPGAARAGDGVVNGDWRRMPLASGSVDLVLADGSFTPLDVAGGYPDVCRELRRVVRVGGRCIFRCFVQADVQETPDEVFAELARGRIKNFHVLRFRLLMALQSDVREGVPLARAWEALCGAWPDLDQLADRQGWAREQVHLIDAYRNDESRYSFPTLAECAALFRAGGFALVSSAASDYELGERFPTLVLRRGDEASPR